MSWLFPGFLAGALAIGIPLALHLLRRWPRRPVVFPSLRFLSPNQRRVDNLWQRICRWLVLLLRCAIVALLAAAFARPFHGGDPSRESRAVVIVVDNSFSLQAGDRWDRLKTWANEKSGSFATGDKLGVMLMAPQPSWLVAPTVDIERARQALAALPPGWLTAHIEPALRMAGEALAAIPADRRAIIVLTDHQRLSWLGTDFARQLPPGIEAIFPDIPAPVERQAMILPPALTSTPTGLRAAVSIRNLTGVQTRTLRVFRDGSNTPLREETLELAPKETRLVEINLAGTTAQPARFRFALDSDALAADDTTYAIWQPASTGLLLLDQAPPGLVETNADFVDTALTAAAALKPEFKVTPIPAGDWPLRAVAVLRNDASFSGTTGAQLSAFLSAGGSAVIFATNGPAQPAWFAEHRVPLTPLPQQSESWQVHDWSLDHPLVGALSQRRLEVLLRWEFTAGFSMLPGTVEALAHWSEDRVAIGELRVGSGRMLVCGFAPDRRAGDWPVQASFVPFVHRAPAYLFTAQQSAVATGQTGQPLSLAGDRGEWRAIDGPSAGNPPQSVSGTVTPLTPGIYELTRGNDRRWFAINLPAEESDLAAWDVSSPWSGLVSPRPPTEAKHPRAELAAADAEQRAPLWWWAVAVIAVLMLAELGLANRTAR